MDVIHYFKLKTSKDGFNFACKECRGNKFGLNQPNKLLDLPDGYKHCKTCSQTLPIESFPICKTKSKDGYASKCKTCKNKLAVNTYDPEQEKERTRPHLEKRYGQKKVYYELNREKIDKKKREYRKTNGYKQLKRFSNEKRRTKKQLLEYNFSKKQWKECINHFDGLCCYCGEQVEILSMDHFIPLSKGGEWTLNNIVPSCISCNSSKQHTDFSVWYPKHKSYSKQREQKILKYLNYNENNMQQLALL